MIVIKATPPQLEAIRAHKRMDVMKTVIEAAEAEHMNNLKHAAQPENFRLYQGILQALDAVKQLLP